MVLILPRNLLESSAGGQQEKASEERPAHVSDDDDVEHHKTSTGEGTSAPAPEDSRFKDVWRMMITNIHQTRVN
jgi:hypothetical protein